MDEPYYHIGTPLVAYLDPALFPVQVPVPDLIIMLVNSGRGTIIAGNADILHRVAYITVGDLIDTDPADSLSWDPLQSPLCSGFLETALHESGHAIAALADEDIRCLPYDGWKHPNMVWIPDWQNPPPVPWVNLAQQGELLSSGHLRAVQSLDGQCRVPTASSPSEHNTPVYTSEAAGELRWRFPNLGLYWGCLYIDAGTPGGLASLAGSCSIFDDVKGLHFYRGQVLCRMRIMGQPFCRVCSDAIARRILSPDDPWEYP